jgi:flagellin
MVINSNLPAQTASTRLAQSSTMLAQSLQRLSSGSKITSPADDGAGLAVSMKLNSQMVRLDAVDNNLANAISFTQTQDAYLQKIGDSLTRMSELTVLAQDVTKTTSDRLDYDQEMHSLENYVHSVVNKDFNGVSLFSANSLNVTTDGDANSFAMTGINLQNNTYNNLYGDRVNPIGDVSTGAVYAMNDVKKVLDQLATDRATVGSNLEALTHYSDQIATLKNSLAGANSQITDVDVAQESMTYARDNILTQTGTAMLAQANSLPQSVLKLLG